ncbi:hypothetical protein VTL71DRAFT_8537 [Oculimacula yallundae]|uniref:Nephrocystin 3-like N-terminal domain-containing protein n=1 Tax=Oculimacula yallundae TaxID=86028 RepID=A0ABR4CY39_9HELO
MAEAVGVAGSIIAIVGLTQQIVALAKKNIHSTEHGHTVLSNLLGRLTAYKGLFEGLQVQAESHESNAIRLSVLDHVGGPLAVCSDALGLIKSSLEKRRGKLLIVGKILSKDITNALEKLDQLRPILQIALEADQRILLEAIESYAKTISEDLQKLQSTTDDLYEDVKLSLNYQEKWREYISAARVEKQKTEETIRQRKVLDWTSTLIYQKSHQQILVEARHDGTLEWSIESLSFTKWFSCTHRHLWLSASAGSGKSVHSAFLIKHLQQVCKSDPSTKKAIAFYYFDSNDDQGQTINGFLRSLIVQLSCGQDNLPESTQKFYDTYSKDGPSSLVKQDHLIRTVAVLLGLHSSTFVVLDAIDELPEIDIDSLFDVLQQLSDLAGNKLKLLCSSRPSILMDDEIERLGWRTTNLRGDEIEADIAQYVRHCIGTRRAFFRLETELRQNICSKIVQSAQGMFLMARLQIERLEKAVRKCRRPKDILTVLESWPQEVFGMYEKMLCDIPKTSQEELRRALLLVCFSKIPVTLAEVAEFAVINPSRSMFSIDDRFETPAALLRLSGSLFINSQTRLYLSHHSVQEYLVSDHIKAGPARHFAIEEDEAAQEILHTSLTYIQIMCNSDLECLETTGIATIASAHSFTQTLNYDCPISTLATTKDENTRNIVKTSFDSLVWPSTEAYHNIETLKASGPSTTALAQIPTQKPNIDYPLANLASLQWIAASPALREKYKAAMENILGSRQSLARVFGWLVHNPGRSRAFQNYTGRTDSTFTDRLQLAIALAKALLLTNPTSRIINSAWTSNNIEFIPKTSSNGLPPPGSSMGSTVLASDRIAEITSFLNHPWWSRVWVFQELLLAGPGLDVSGNNVEDTLRNIMFMNSNALMPEAFDDAVNTCLSSILNWNDLRKAKNRVDEDAPSRETYQQIIQPLESLLAPFVIFRKNMDLLAFSEAPENVSLGVRLVKEAYQKFEPQHRVRSRAKDLEESTEEFWDQKHPVLEDWD